MQSSPTTFLLGAALLLGADFFFLLFPDRTWGPPAIGSNDFGALRFRPEPALCSRLAMARSTSQPAESSAMRACTSLAPVVAITFDTLRSISLLKAARAFRASLSIGTPVADH